MFRTEKWPRLTTLGLFFFPLASVCFSKEKLSNTATNQGFRVKDAVQKTLATHYTQLLTWEHVWPSVYAEQAPPRQGADDCRRGRMPAKQATAPDTQKTRTTLRSIVGTTISRLNDQQSYTCTSGRLT